MRLTPSVKGAAHGRNLANLLARGAYQLTVLGAALVPSHGGLILASNHVGFLDGPLLFSVAPRPIHFLARSELFTPPMDRLLNGLGQIPLDEESADRDAVAVALRLLAEGHALGMFPEAQTASGDFSRMQHGIAYLHTRAKAPIVPVAILGTRSTGQSRQRLPGFRAPLTVVFGEPFVVAPLSDPDKRSTLAAVGEGIRQRLADHVASAVAATGIALPNDDPSNYAEQAESA